MRFRHSSSSRPSAMISALRPVAGIVSMSARSPFPVPGVGASIKCSGVRSPQSSRAKGRSIAPRAWARAASSAKGKSPRSSSRSRSRASPTCSGDGHSSTAGILKPEPAWKQRRPAASYPGRVSSAPSRLNVGASTIPFRIGMSCHSGRTTDEPDSIGVARRRARMLAISPWLGARSQTRPKRTVATKTMVPPAATFA